MNKFGTSSATSTTSTSSTVPTLTQVLAKSSISDGTANQVLQTDGSGTRSFATAPKSHQLVAYVYGIYNKVTGTAVSTSWANSRFRWATSQVLVGSAHMSQEDAPGEYDTITIPEDGCYKFTYGTRICGSGDGNIYIRVKRSGTVVFTWAVNHSGVPTCGAGSAHILWNGFQTGDTVSFHANSNSNSTNASVTPSYTDVVPSSTSAPTLTIEKLSVYA